MFWFQAGARAVVSRIACEDADGLERVAARSVHSGRPAGIAVADLGSGVEGAANLGSAHIVVWGLFGRCAERIDHQAEILGQPRLSRATVNHARDCVWRGVTAPQVTALRRELTAWAEVAGPGRGVVIARFVLADGQ